MNWITGVSVLPAHKRNRSLNISIYESIVNKCRRFNHNYYRSFHAVKDYCPDRTKSTKYLHLGDRCVHRIQTGGDKDIFLIPHLGTENMST